MHKTENYILKKKERFVDEEYCVEITKHEKALFRTLDKFGEVGVNFASEML